MRKNNGATGKKMDTTNGTRFRDELAQRVSRQAYEFYEQRGGEPSHDIEDWLKAERLVLGLEHHRKEEE